MKSRTRPVGLFPAQLRYWRNRRGLSQLDFSLVADVSARHISFLETGRAKPSREMVLRLATVLAVPLRDQNAMLRAAGHDVRFEEPERSAVPTVVSAVVTRMLEASEPWPMVVMDGGYDVLQVNQAGARLLSRVIADPTALPVPLNPVKMVFDPRLSRPFVKDWEILAGSLLSRLHQEALIDGQSRLHELIDLLLAYPDVPTDWRHPDFSMGTGPVLTLRLDADGHDLAFLVAMTQFSEPQSSALEELVIETYLPQDEATAAFCRDHLA